ncbi:MAG: 2-oxoacid:acceptor oxidoreductase subunit alpha [Anaerolineae bacterium]|nr:2-oxoacid:acceptor oxidoreductase subunit alpha [Anaerolineae bacterium]
MTINDMTIRIGGAAGDGVESSGAGFCQALVRGGLHIFGLPDYHSRIRGGHNFFSIRISDQPLYSHDERVHLLLALTEETIPRHQNAVVEGSAIVYDSSQIANSEWQIANGLLLPIPLSEMAKDKAGTELARNTVALGVAIGLTGFDLEPVEGVIRQNFARKGQAVVDGNLAAVEAGYREGQKRAADFPFKLQGRLDAPPRMVLNGNEAFALGALAGGCRFVAGYPMTPGSPVLEWMAGHATRYGVVTVQVEDEIAAACAVVGAAHAGARAMAPTSGGGFCLMVEALGLAGMTETPIVVYEAQRPGPSTGLATRTEQGDLWFVLHASHGEFPRIVLAPGTIEQAFETGWRAFNLAERYQCPVIVLADHFLATSLRDVPPEALDFDQVIIDRGGLLSDVELDGLTEEYRRYAFTENGISPRVIPGHPKGVYSATSDEHDEHGHIEEDADNRRRMMAKRMRKLEEARKKMRSPTLYGPQKAEVTFIGWGSTYGPLREAVDRLNAQGEQANMLHLTDLWPFPAEPTAQVLAAAKKIIAVENNYSGQMADLMRMTTGHQISGRILKYDGRPLSPEYILKNVKL